MVGSVGVEGEPVGLGAAVWADAGVAGAYAASPQGLAERAGHPAVFGALRLDPARPARLLDYGCGPGTAARAAAGRLNARVCAVDTSPAMLALARRNPALGVDFRLSPDGRVRFVPDGSMDACMCCFLFVCVPTREGLGAVAAEILRVLRPGGRVAVLSTHPASIGVDRYDSWDTEPGPYRDGQPVRSLLRGPHGARHEVVDTFWSARAHHDVLAAAGLSHVRARRVADPPNPGGSGPGGLLLVTAQKPA